MDQTAIKAGAGGPIPAPLTNGQAAPPVGINGTTDETPKTAPKFKHPARQALELLADLRITVALFAMALLLVFWGTLAQVDNGVWTIVQKYFRSPFVLVPLKVVSFFAINDTKTVIPFPGGWLIGTAMMINLLAAHAIRFKLTWNRAGIFLIHIGIILMMMGELITGLYAHEGHMIIPVGKSASTVVDERSSELAVIRTHEDDPKKDDVITIPARLLKTGAVVDDPKIPFRIEVNQFMINSRLLNQENRQATKGFGRFHIAEERAEANGVEADQEIDIPAAYIKLTDRAGKDLGTWLFTPHLDDRQWIEADGKKYQVVLRFKQTPRRFKMHLTKFTHDVFPGTNIAKDFHSYIRLTDPDTGMDRDVEIFMNHPLYYNGETFYQARWQNDERGQATVLQVVRNPGWLLPYLSCGVVGIGLLIHFGITLYRFLNRRTVR